MTEVRNELSAKVFAKKYAVSEFSVPESAIAVTGIMLVAGAKLAKNSYSVMLNVTHKNGTIKSHQLAIDIKLGSVTLIY